MLCWVWHHVLCVLCANCAEACMRAGFLSQHAGHVLIQIPVKGRGDKNVRPGQRAVHT